MQGPKDLGPIINMCGHNAMRVHSRMKVWPKDETCIGFHFNAFKKNSARHYTGVSQLTGSSGKRPAITVRSQSHVVRSDMHAPASATNMICAIEELQSVLD